MKTKDELMAELKALGVALLVIEYSGGGDSGAIDAISAYVADNGTSKDVDELFRATHDEITVRVSQTLMDEQPKDFSTRLEEYAYEFLLDDLSDWCNNDGGSGKVMVFVEPGLDDHGNEHEAGEIHIHHRTFYTETNYEEITL